MTKADILKELDDLGWQNAKAHQDDRCMVRRGVSLVVAMVIINSLSASELDAIQQHIQAKLTDPDAPTPGWVLATVH